MWFSPLVFFFLTANAHPLRPCVVVNQYNAPIMGRFATRVIPVSMRHYSIKWCSGNIPNNAPPNLKKDLKKKEEAYTCKAPIGQSKSTFSSNMHVSVLKITLGTNFFKNF
ncbi:hypothetical protein HanRHA438_Chr04g0178561 [Helianthus annuus]|nr:hypothetical protein HanRHA438_Chr04g0178561 [Helianthus annuus]